MIMRNYSFLALLVVIPILILAACVAQNSNPAVAPTPGFNMFSKQQDIQLGQQAAQQVRQQYQVVQNQTLQDFATRLGTRLASQAQAQGYPYSFTMLNSKDVNAFALPGGPTFVFSQIVLFADNEAELAGVLAHEISHVALRHGTNQVSKQNLISIPAEIAAATIDGGTMGQLVQLGLGVGLNGLFLHYSRTDESQADALGTRIMAEAGYNPIEMANMFEKLAKQGGPGVPEFLSDHPSPGNRVRAVQAIIRTLPQRNYGYSTGEFAKAQQLVKQLPPPPPPKQAPNNGQ